MNIERELTAMFAKAGNAMVGRYSDRQVKVTHNISEYYTELLRPYNGHTVIVCQQPSLAGHPAFAIGVKSNGVNYLLQCGSEPHQFLLTQRNIDNAFARLDQCLRAAQ